MNSFYIFSGSDNNLLILRMKTFASSSFDDLEYFQQYWGIIYLQRLVRILS